jgi:NAD(P)-dependent dehydrogenase (short-subunit alcohol dehydrogenase family)
MSGPLEGKVAVVTGAGRPHGIGRTTAVRLAEYGAHVVVTDLADSPRAAEGSDPGGAAQEDDELERTASLCRQEGVDALAIVVDVTKTDDVTSCIDRALQRFDRIDILFNNAGTPVGVGPFLNLDDGLWELSWQVNVMGMVRMCRAAIPHMRRNGGGTIINNASIAGLGAIDQFAAYTTTKFGVVGLTKCIAVEFGPDGIRCNAICPGLIETLMGIHEQELFAERWGVPPAEARRRLEEEVPLGRWGAPSDVADVVAYLAGPHAAYLNGVTIPVAGGLSPGL